LFRDKVAAVEDLEILELGGPLAARVLPHEELEPARVERIVEEWRRSGIQHTPITLVRSGAALIVADGHHRWEAARRLAETHARPIRVMVRYWMPTGNGHRIAPAHRIVKAAPAGWAEQCRAALRRRLRVVETGGAGLALCTASGIDRYGCEALTAADQLRLLWELAPLTGFDWQIEADAIAAADAPLRQGAQAAILVPVLTLDEVVAAATSGRLLPPRSTNFQPKPIEGSIRFPIAGS
jgi:hypothetical protein